MIICDGCDRSFHFSPRRGHDRITLGEKNPEHPSHPSQLYPKMTSKNFQKFSRAGVSGPHGERPSKTRTRSVSLRLNTSNTSDIVSERLRRSQSRGLRLSRKNRPHRARLDLSQSVSMNSGLARPVLARLGLILGRVMQL